MSTDVMNGAEMATALRPARGRRELTNVVMTVLMVAAVIVVLVPLALVLINVAQKGAGAMSWDFLTEKIPPQSKTGPGMGPAVVGTLLITGAATLMAVPLGVLGAIYLNEYGGSSRFSRVVRFMSYVMTGVPSIVMGLFIYSVWVLRFKQTGFAGALALACLMLPIVIRSTEEMLRLVPSGLREASLALGTTKARTIGSIVLPAAAPGVVSGCLLAIARAAGETAPIIVCVGVVSKTNTNLFKNSNTTLSAQIYNNAGAPFAGAVERAYGAALTLVLLAFLLTLLARVVTARLATKR